jgi:hypothetical protein
MNKSTLTWKHDDTGKELEGASGRVGEGEKNHDYWDTLRNVTPFE